MRITSKGQVTIPLELRRKAGLFPNTQVEFEFRNNVILIRKGRREKSRGERLIEKMRGAGPGNGMTTDEIMALTRGEE